MNNMTLFEYYCMYRNRKYAIEHQLNLTGEDIVRINGVCNDHYKMLHEEGIEATLDDCINFD